MSTDAKPLTKLEKILLDCILFNKNLTQAKQEILDLIPEKRISKLGSIGDIFYVNGHNQAIDKTHARLNGEG